MYNKSIILQEVIHLRKTEEYSISLSSEAQEPRKKRKNGKMSLFDVFQSVVAAVVVVTIFSLFCFNVFNVEGPSMRPTLEPGDKIVVSNIGYKPQPGDIVVITDADNNKESLCKRVIAVAGDEVDINFATGVVTVNGREEHYSEELTKQQADIAFPLTVPEGTIFVLGDNRDVSLDSRSSRVGCVDERLIVGKVLFRFFPLGDWTVE